MWSTDHEINKSFFMQLFLACFYAQLIWQNFLVDTRKFVYIQYMNKELVQYSNVPKQSSCWILNRKLDFMSESWMFSVRYLSNDLNTGPKISQNRTFISLIFGRLGNSNTEQEKVWISDESRFQAFGIQINTIAVWVHLQQKKPIPTCLSWV